MFSPAWRRFGNGPQAVSGKAFGLAVAEFHDPADAEQREDKAPEAICAIAKALLVGLL